MPKTTLTSKEFCEKFGIQSYVERIVKHYEYRDMSDNIVFEYDKKEDGLWHDTTAEKLLEEITRTQQQLEELTNEQKL